MTCEGGVYSILSKKITPHVWRETRTEPSDIFPASLADSKTQYSTRCQGASNPRCKWKLVTYFVSF